ncbi:hypothetical protein [Jeotgalibacillus soli]|uniref:Uncharacterized protein n=1 Tax=Jeotgalibacillus soli TaxID=889306 RepID=A0A0C2V8T3_9BACL|nr:hypothetical protein [Jeotgalibacillus soli]KIL45377.1 hypothetical protein KP78_29210 [Jeotgalibacillus soli]
MKTITGLQIGVALENIELNPVTRLDLIKYACTSGAERHLKEQFTKIIEMSNKIR